MVVDATAALLDCSAWADGPSAEVLGLIERLRRAEAVCVLFGWCAMRGHTARDAAVTQAWMEWCDLVGTEFNDPAAHPELDISAMAQKRWAIEAETLRRIAAIPGLTA